MSLRSSGLLSVSAFAVAWVTAFPLLGAPDVSEPWSVSAAAPVFSDVEERPTRAVSFADMDSTGSVFCYGWLRFYQVYLPAVTRSACPMHPSCSRFAVLAIGKHGPFWGIAMTADRLMREGTETKMSPIVQVNGRFACLDPVESNDFWWENR